MWISGHRLQDVDLRTSTSGRGSQDIDFRTSPSGRGSQDIDFRTSPSRRGSQDIDFRISTSGHRLQDIRMWASPFPSLVCYSLSFVKSRGILERWRVGFAAATCSAARSVPGKSVAGFTGAVRRCLPSLNYAKANSTCLWGLPQHSCGVKPAVWGQLIFPSLLLSLTFLASTHSCRPQALRKEQDSLKTLHPRASKKTKKNQKNTKKKKK
ncbi:unnamed protein product [Mortierella alpina]